MPKVSVIIPVYNVEKYLKECLDSILSQTFSDLEVICINDGSTDNSLAILEEYARKDSRIKVISQENKGPAIARNVGLEHATGKYISIIDSDDIYELNMYEKMYQVAEKDDLDIVICHSCEFDSQTGERYITNWHINDEKLPKRKNIFNRHDIPDYIIGFCQGWSWDKLYKRDFIVQNNIKFQDLRNTDDMYFVMFSLCIAEKICVINDVLVHHRINIPNSVSNSRDKNPQCFIDAIYLLKKSLEDRSLYQELKRSFINWNILFSFWHLDTLQLQKNKNDLAKRLQTELFPNLDVFSFNKEFFYYNNLYKRIHSKDFILKESFIKTIFYIKNSTDKRHKIITIFGIKIKIRRKNAKS